MDLNVINKLTMISEHARQQKERYNQLSKNSINTKKTLFLPIRHFNSDTPVKPGYWENVPYTIASRPVEFHQGGFLYKEPVFIGGGYFLRHKGVGIAIDPGYGFIYALFHYHGITVRNIDYVVITHDHMDHHADLESIIMLKQKKEESLSIIAIEEVLDTYRIKYRSKIEGSILKFTNIRYGNPFSIPNTSIKINPLPALHWQRCTNKGSIETTLNRHLNTIGLYISIEDINKNILISGDTIFPIYVNHKWVCYSERKFEDIPYMNPRKACFLGWKPSDVKKVFEKTISNILLAHCEKMIEAYNNLGNCDIVCLHLGSIKGINHLIHTTNISSTKWEEVINNPSFCYPGFHLGFTGCIRLLKLLMNNGKFNALDGLVVLTEFGEELLGHRRDIADCIIKTIIDMDMNIDNLSVLPSDITLNIIVSNDKTYQNEGITNGVICNFRRDLNNWQDVVAIEGPGEIITYVLKMELGKAHPDCVNI